MFEIVKNLNDVNKYKVLLENPKAGAYVSFEGWVRDNNEGKKVQKLEYEAYQVLSEKEGNKILSESLARYDILDAACVHRVGMLQIGDLAVWIGVNAGHRKDAFKACEYIINQIKTRVPIWKREYYTDGDSGWVKCDHCNHTVSI